MEGTKIEIMACTGNGSETKREIGAKLIKLNQFRGFESECFRIESFDDALGHTQGDLRCTAIERQQSDEWRSFLLSVFPSKECSLEYSLISEHTRLTNHKLWTILFSLHIERRMNSGRRQLWHTMRWASLFFGALLNDHEVCSSACSTWSMCVHNIFSLEKHLSLPEGLCYTSFSDRLHPDDFW